MEMDYSTDQFVAFMEERGGADINHWSFEEL